MEEIRQRVKEKEGKLNRYNNQINQRVALWVKAL